jgi:catechol 2,3-dioxygenase-like lactoylglutathione lyase family enzyme
MSLCEPPLSIVLDHVQLAAPPGCEDAARAFYGDLLGLTEIDKPQPLRAHGGVWFELGLGQLHIGVEDPFSPARKAHPALRAAGRRALDELAGRLQAAGAPVQWDSEVDGLWRFYTADPWGNRLELLAYAAVGSGASRSPLPR